MNPPEKESMAAGPPPHLHETTLNTLPQGAFIMAADIPLILSRWSDAPLMFDKMSKEHNKLQVSTCLPCAYPFTLA